MVWQPGHQLDSNRYVIEKILGEGGFGITYLAKDKQGKPVVIKTLLDKLVNSPDCAVSPEKYKDDFWREAVRLAKCQHHHIVHIEDVFHHESLPCIAMEYIEGETLAQRVKNCGVLSETEALKYIRQIGEALTIVHEKGLLHRDVKPQNIMLRSDRPEAVLIDFGIAREFIPDLTQTHTVLFSDGYAPLEQYDEQERRDKFTDVYALAATLYYLLTKKVPVSALKRQWKDLLKPPKHFNQKISNTVNQAILAGMAVKAENRPQSVEEWLKLFESDTDDLRSEKGLDYRKLRDYLKAGNWKKADQETRQVMLKAANREEEGWFDKESIDNFPCTDLRTIDQLWVKYSTGRFGFSVQKRFWLKAGGKIDYETECRLGDWVGWRVEGKWKEYDELTFSLKAPEGHLPVPCRVFVVGVGMDVEVGVLISRPDL